MANKRKARPVREIIRERMQELDIRTTAELYRLVEGRGVVRSHLYAYLTGKVDMGADALAEVLDAIDLVIVPRYRVLR